MPYSDSLQNVLRPQQQQQQPQIDLFGNFEIKKPTTQPIIPSTTATTNNPNTANKVRNREIEITLVDLLIHFRMIYGAN